MSAKNLPRALLKLLVDINQKCKTQTATQHTEQLLPPSFSSRKYFFISNFTITIPILIKCVYVGKQKKIYCFHLISEYHVVHMFYLLPFFQKKQEILFTFFTHTLQNFRELKIGGGTLIHKRPRESWILQPHVSLGIDSKALKNFFLKRFSQIYWTFDTGQYMWISILLSHETYKALDNWSISTDAKNWYLKFKSFSDACYIEILSNPTIKEKRKIGMRVKNPFNEYKTI